MRTQEELWTALLASVADAVGGREPVEIGGRRYLDGGMASPIPVAEAIAAGATHVLALQTRPFGVPRKSASGSATGSSSATCAGSIPALVAVYRRADRGVRAAGGGHRRAAPRRGDGAPPHVLGIRPAAGTPCVGQLERRSAVLAEAAADAERLVEAALSTGTWLRAAPAAVT